MPYLFIVDAYSDARILYPDRHRPPRVLDTLRAAAEPDGLPSETPILAPAVFCQSDDAARVRGALLITDDQDGVAIVLPPGLGAADLATIAAAHGWRRDPACKVGIIAPGDTVDQARWLTPQPVCEQVAFHPSRLKGCLIPSDWLLLAAQTAVPDGAPVGAPDGMTDGEDQ